MSTWEKQDKADFRALVEANPDLKNSDEAARPYSDKYGYEAVSRRIRRILRPDKTAAEKAAEREVTHEEGLLLAMAEKARKRRQPLYLLDACNDLNQTPLQVNNLVASLRRKAYKIKVDKSAVKFEEPTKTGFRELPTGQWTDGRWVRLGVIADTHFGNRHARVDAVHAAYEVYKAQGIKEVFHLGNWIDGIHERIGAQEHIGPSTFDWQTKYFVANWPQVPGITTHILSGDDHEGWTQQKGIDVGMYLEGVARRAGREDIKDLGYLEVDVPFRASPTGKAAKVRLGHYKDGSAAAVSHVAQKTIDNYDTDDVVQMLMLGHYHKAGFFTWRNIPVLLGGCLEEYSIFMKGKKLQAHMGYWILEFMVTDDGRITRLRPEWFPVQKQRRIYALNDTPDVSEGEADAEVMSLFTDSFAA